jgi:glycosyltransferase involved in cell wall biosynthesis
MAEKVAARRKRTTKQTSNGRTKKPVAAKAAFSVIIYVFNQQDELADIYQTLLAGIKNKRRKFEVIFVDDSSQDNSWQVLREIAEKDKRVKLIRFRTNFGEAAAFDAGLKQANGEKIAFFTTRVRINTEHIGQMIERLDDSCDLVMGWRHPRRDSSLNQRISRWFNVIIKKIAKHELHDINSGVFAAKREVLNDIPIYGNLNIFLPILASRKGYRVGDEQIEQLPGVFRQSKSVTEYITRSLDILAVFFLTNYSKKPLHFLGFVGSIFTLIGLGMNLYLFLYRLLQFGPIAGRPLLLLGALSLVIGIQMISIGLIGEMIIFTHAREIKEYNIEEILD